MHKGAVSSIVALALLVGACAAQTKDVAREAKTAAAAAAVPTPDAEEPADDDGAADAEDDVPAGDARGADHAGPCPDDMALVETTGADGAARRYCIDKYEASLVEVLPDGTERPFPHYVVVDGHDVRAVSRPHVFPQGFISEVQAQDACAASNKHLCTYDEWKVACMGPQRTTFPYGAERRAGMCHDSGKSAVGAVFGAKALASAPPPATHGASRAPTSSGASSGAFHTSTAPSAPVKVAEVHAAKSRAGDREGVRRAHATRGRAASTTRPRASNGKSAVKTAGGKGSGGSASGAGASGAPNKKSAPGALATRRTGKKSTRPPTVDLSVWTRLNDPALGQVEGALAKTGEHEQCVNAFGVFDMVGNLHEWVATDPSAPHGTFAGGYYLDTSINGDGCNYRTVAHAHDYHDYSTGFRCCASAERSSNRSAAE